MKRHSELKSNAQDFVRETMLRSGQQPSQKAIKQAAVQIVKALEPVMKRRSKAGATEAA